MYVWRCSVCKKTKNLEGKHLNGKTEVRSDCWPCAKKRTFMRESSSPSALPATAVAASVTAAPFISKSAENPNPFNVTALSAATSSFAGTNQTWRGTTAGRNPLGPAAGVQSGVGDAGGQQKGLAPIVMLSASPADRLRQSPPFTFSSSPEIAAAGMNKDAASVTTNNGGNSSPVWRCSVCKKAKDLQGKHLNGKTEVRSDCWPCAKKRTFVLVNSTCSSSSPLSLMSLPSSTTTEANTLLKTAAQNAPVNSHGTRSVESTMTTTTVWKNPVIPIKYDDNSTCFITHHHHHHHHHGFSRDPSEKNQVESTTRSESPESMQQNELMLPHTITFESEVLRGYRQQLVDGIRTCTAWHNRTFYVLAPENSGSKNIAKVGATELGTAAAVFLALEHKLALSPFRLMRRIFCPDEFTFAAACMYVNTFLAGCPTSTRQSLFLVYGPQVDHTVPMTRLGPIIEKCTHARQRVVGAEQRVDGAQHIYRNTGWLTLPLHATAEAIRLLEVQQEDDDAMAAGSLGVDVVLVAKRMKLEELSHAAALALPVKPF